MFFFCLFFLVFLLLSSLLLSPLSLSLPLTSPPPPPLPPCPPHLPHLPTHHPHSERGGRGGAFFPYDIYIISFLSPHFFFLLLSPFPSLSPSHPHFPYLPLHPTSPISPPAIPIPGVEGGGRAFFPYDIYIISFSSPHFFFLLSPFPSLSPPHPHFPYLPLHPTSPISPPAIPILGAEGGGGRGEGHFSPMIYISFPSHLLTSSSSFLPFPLSHLPNPTSPTSLSTPLPPSPHPSSPFWGRREREGRGIFPLWYIYHFLLISSLLPPFSLSLFLTSPTPLPLPPSPPHFPHLPTHHPHSRGGGRGRGGEGHFSPMIYIYHFLLISSLLLLPSLSPPHPHFPYLPLHPTSPSPHPPSPFQGTNFWPQIWHDQKKLSPRPPPGCYKNRLRQANVPFPV